MAERTTPEEEVRRLYEEAETRTAKAMEQLVSRESFGELLARMTENTLALVNIGNDVFDLIVRNLRIAGRRDITALAKQLARTEDKLELVLQEVERLQDRLGESGENGAAPARAPAANRRSSSRSKS
jgi:5'-deoxynucleotidase YfbR-like HD superfamily hydrolase